MTADGVDLRDPAALPTAAAALGRHVDALRTAAAASSGHAAKLRQSVDHTVVIFRGRLQSAQLALAAVRPDDERAIANARAQVRAAEQTVARGVTLQRELERVLEDLQRTVSSQLRTAEQQADAGISALSRFWEQLGRSLSAFAAAAQATVPSIPVVAAWAPSTRQQSGAELAPIVGAPIGSTGQVLVSVDQIDVDIPVTEFKDPSLPELLAGLERLEAVVLPIVASGGGLNEVQARDDALSAGGAYVQTFHHYFGAEPVKLDMKADGRYDPRGGRHRIEAARRARLDAIPALVGGRR